MNLLMNYIIVVSFNHVGDYNQALEMQLLLQKMVPNQIQVTLVDAEGAKFHQLFAEKTIRYVHSLGQKGMIQLANSKRESPAVLEGRCIIVQIHQHFQELVTIKPHLLIIPELNYSERQELKETEKILLMGTIFQKLTSQKLQEAYRRTAISEELNQQESYIIVMLSGDAPDQEKMKYFTKESVDVLLLRLSYLLAVRRTEGFDCTIIVQNGPRTGKHDPLTGKEQCLHKFNHGEDPQSAIDPISSYFINKLEENGIRHYFYNFSFEMFGQKRVVNSFYKPLLYLAQKPSNIFMFPMESISMCSELPYYIKPSQLYAYHTSSVNESHMKFVRGGFERGLYRMFEKKLEIVYPKNEAQEKYDETEKIIEKIIQRIQHDLHLQSE